MRARSLVTAAVAALGVLAAAVAAAAAVPKPADVSIKVLTSSSDTYVAGKIVYNVLVADLGGVDAANVTVEIAIGGDGNGVAVAVTQSAGSCAIAAPTHVTCSIPVVSHGKTAKIRVQVKPTLPGHVDLSATASAAANASTANDSATATTIVHPGKPGPPEVRMSGRPKGATLDQKQRTAILKGRIDVSEPGQLTFQVVDRVRGTTVPLLVRSVVASTRLGVREDTMTVPVGDAATAHSIHVLYALRLAAAKLRPARVYTLVVQATDLEGQSGAALEIPFRLSKPKK